jgi:hypothetical protein
MCPGLLPDKWDEVAARARAIFGVAGQVAAKVFLLVEQAEDECPALV